MHVLHRDVNMIQTYMSSFLKDDASYRTDLLEAKFHMAHVNREKVKAACRASKTETPDLASQPIAQSIKELACVPRPLIGYLQT